MPKDKSASHARIVPAARKEFLEKGFEKASMRSIAQAAGITSAGLYRHFDEFKLLLCCSSGTRYENFVHDFVTAEQEKTEAFLRAVRETGAAVKEIDSRELHLLLSAYTSAFFEVIIHDFTREEAEHYLATFQQFFYPGWRAVLGF